MIRPRRLRVVVLAGLLACVAGGCGGGVQELSFPNPAATNTTAEASQPTFPDDLSGVTQNVVAGAPTTTAPVMGPGGASLDGTVIGPAGPVAGATVEVDRLVGDTGVATRTSTAADGSWSVSGVLGGRFRVRAWQSPSLTMSTPDVVFLSATQTLSVTLRLTRFQGPALAAATSPAAPILGQPVNLVVQVTTPTVSVDGVLQYLPDPGVGVALADGPGWRTGTATVTTDARGDATFPITCQSPGPDPLSASVASAPPVALSVPACGLPPTTTVATTTTVASNPCPTTTTSLFQGQPTTSTSAFSGC